MNSASYFMDLMTAEEKALMTRLSALSELEPLCLERYADLPAVNLPERIVSYKELWEEVALYRKILADNNIKHGEKVAIIIPNSLECIEAFLATATFGAVAVMVQPMGPVAAKEEACNVAGCKYAFCKETIPGIQLLPCSIEGCSEGLPSDAPHG